MQPLRIALVGLNARVERVILPGLAASPRARLVALCSRDRQKAATFAASYPGCRPFDDLAEMLTLDDVDALFVATPPELHAEMSLAAIERGLAVCCEKPLAASLAEASAMAAAARARGVRTAVNFTYRSSPGFRTLADALLDPGIGPPLHADVSYLQNRALLAPGPYRDPLTDLGPHPFDALLWWADLSGAGEPQRVAAFSSPPDRSTRSSSGEPLSWAVLIEWSRGMTTAVRLSRAAAGARNAVFATLSGAAGALGLDFDTDRALVRHSRASDPSADWSVLPIPAPYQVDFRSFPALHFDRIAGALLGQEAFPDFEQGLRVQAILEAAAEAARQGCVAPVATAA